MKYSLSIHEAHSDIPDYNRPRIHLSWAQNRLSKTKSLQLNTHEAFLCLCMIFLEHEHHDIPEFCLSTTSGNHTINHVCHPDRNILTQSGKMFVHLTWTKCHQITLAQLLLLSPHKSSHGIVDLFKIPARFERDTRGWPSKQFLSLWPGQKYASMLPSPSRCESYKLLFEARGSSRPTSKLCNMMPFCLKPEISV